MKESVFDLLPELTERMAEATIQAHLIRGIKCDNEFYFIHIGDKEYVNPQYLSFEDQFKIIEFVRFLKEHPNLNNRTLKEIFAQGDKFYLLKDVYKTIPNILCEARSHDDEKYIPYLYFGLKQTCKNMLNC